ncbi:MAG: metal ABC transporter permease [Oscillospiraceae bacterium]|jgi:zinc transport system permease protein|nr:metal ABC transporter permease [Oscillospiraceae bacterium]
MFEFVRGTLVDMFSLQLVIRALVVGTLVALCAALLGVTLVLKRYSMIGDGLSHVGFGTLALAMGLSMVTPLNTVITTPLMVSIPLVLITAFFLLRISENSKIKGDAAIALISSSALAIGVVIIKKTVGMSADVCNYMFGAIMAMQASDVWWSVGVAAAVLALFVLFYHSIFAVTFDETFARATGTKAGFYNMLIALLTALTVVIGMRLMGAMLISSLIIFPALTAMRLCRSFRSVTVCAAVLSVVCFFVGIFTSYAWDTPAGASVVLVNLLGFLLFTTIAALRSAINKRRETQ